LQVFTHHWVVSRYKDGKRQNIPQEFGTEGDALELAQSIAFEEVHDFDLGKRIRRPLPIHNIPWTQKLDALPDGIVIEDICTENAGNSCARRVYDAPRMPKPSERPELKGTM